MRDAEGPGRGRRGQKAWRSGAGPAPGGTECGLTIQGSQVLSLKKPQSGFHLRQLGRWERSPFHTPVQGILDKNPDLPVVFWPGQLRGQRSLAGSGPRGRKESDTTKRLTQKQRVGGASPGAMPAKQETWVQPPRREDPPEKEPATRSSALAWQTPRTEEPGGLQSSGPQRSLGV